MKHGILNICKPQGMTSHDVVRVVRRITGIKRVGHTGTLDPLATGVLPICVGEATRLSEYLMDGEKAYLAEMDFGYMTDTFDITGKVTQEAGVFDIAPKQLEEVLAQHTGVLLQTPPAYSALKHEGRPLYEYARAGQPVIKEARSVTIFQLQLRAAQLPKKATIYVRCSKGTYIRSLIDDIGKALQCGAVMSALCREQSGGYTLDSAVSPEQLTKENYADYLIDMVEATAHLRQISLDEAEIARIQNGQSISASEAMETSASVALLGSGGLVAIGRYDEKNDTIQPKKVFRQSYESVDD